MIKSMKNYKKAKEKWVKNNIKYVSVHDDYGSYICVSYVDGKLYYNVSKDSDTLTRSLFTYMSLNSNKYEIFFVIKKLFILARSNYKFVFQTDKSFSPAIKLINKDTDMKVRNYKNNMKEE